MTDLTRKIAPTEDEILFNKAWGNTWGKESQEQQSRTGNLMTPRKPGKFIGHSSKER